MSDNFLEQHETPTQITFDELRKALLDETGPVEVRYLYRLSDIEGHDLREMTALWPEIPLWRRQALLLDLQVLAENDFVLSYEAIGRLAIDDSDARIRFGGVQTLIASECEQPDLIPILLNMAEQDVDANVRAVAALALGRFVYIGELGMLSTQTQTTLEDQLLSIARHDSDADVQRRALESLGYAGRNEVVQLIEDAFQSAQTADLASALLAMGRSADERWTADVLAMLDHHDPGVRLEAVRAAGELALAEARQILLALITHEDLDMRMTAIWSLSQIGGDKVFQRLVNALQNATDEDEISFIEQALDNLAFNEDIDGDPGMLLFTQIDDDEDKGLAAWAPALDQEDEDLDDFEAADYYAIEDLLDDDDIMDADEDYGD
jgi:HEAT repeat protein